MNSTVLNVVICIDDTHPENGWGLPDDECVSYLHKLNEEFGCKFVQFIPSCPPPRASRRAAPAA